MFSLLKGCAQRGTGATEMQPGLKSILEAAGAARSSFEEF
jgi:hypothetical protein